MSEGLGYDETVGLLRRLLVEAEGNARGFQVRSRGRPRLLSTRSWAELAQIEALLTRRLFEALRREMRVEPWGSLARLRAALRGLYTGLGSERGVAERLLAACTRAPIASWRAGAPQLEGAVWPFLASRTQYLANTLALALDQPLPFPPLLWHPGRRQFHG